MEAKTPIVRHFIEKLITNTDEQKLLYCDIILYNIIPK